MPSLKYQQFCQAYEKWQADCLEEYNKRYNEERKFFAMPDEFPDDYEPGQLVEFAEDGDAYPHGYGGTGHITKCVTPWAKSPHFVN